MMTSNNETHTLLHPKDCGCNLTSPYCPICDGGLAFCIVCKGGEIQLEEKSCEQRQRANDPVYQGPHSRLLRNKRFCRMCSYLRKALIEMQDQNTTLRLEVSELNKENRNLCLELKHSEEKLQAVEDLYNDSQGIYRMELSAEQTDCCGSVQIPFVPIPPCPSLPLTPVIIEDLAVPKTAVLAVIPVGGRSGGTCEQCGIYWSAGDLHTPRMCLRCHHKQWSVIYPNMSDERRREEIRYLEAYVQTILQSDRRSSPHASPVYTVGELRNLIQSHGELLDHDEDQKGHTKDQK